MEVTHYDTWSETSPPSDLVVQYTYDHQNRLVRKDVDPDGAGLVESASTAFYAYDGSEILLQFDGDGQLEKRYVYGAAVDQVLAEETLHEDPATGELLSDGVRWALADHLGTMRDLAVFDDNGTPGDPDDDSTVIAPEHHFRYDAFGNAIGSTSPAAADFLFGFTGRPFDAETGLQWNLHRWYDASTGRWLSEDPIGFTSGDANLYRYCANNPLNTADPSGLEPKLGAYVAKEAAVVGAAAARHQEAFRKLTEAASRLQAALCNPRNQQALQRAQQSFAQARQELSLASGRLSVAVRTFGRNVSPELLRQGGTKITQAQAIVNSASQQIPSFSRAANLMASTAQRIAAPVQRFNSPDALKRAMGTPEGMVWHHIVEQRGANLAQFGARAIHSTQNCVPVPRSVNQAIADYYSTGRFSFTQGQVVRKWLESQTFEEQYEFGMDILFRVLSDTPLPQ